MTHEELVQMMFTTIRAAEQESRIDAELVLTDINMLHAVQGRPGLFPFMADMGALDILKNPEREIHEGREGIS